MPTHIEQRKVPYTAEQMFNLVADVERYPEFIPAVLKSRIISRRENEVISETVLGQKVFKVTYISKITHIPFERIDITCIQGAFKYLNAYWKFTSKGEEGVLVDFFIDFEVQNPLIHTVMRGVFNMAGQQVVSSFEKRAKVLYDLKK